MDKYTELVQYSNPQKVSRNLQRYLPGTKLYISTRKNKKYMVQQPDGTWSHFGQMGYQDYTKHHDDVRRIHYIQRASRIHGDWKNNMYSPNNLSMQVLWK